MSEEEKSFSLVSAEDIAGFSKPCIALIDKISEAVGGLCRPWQMVRVAKAEAEVAVIKAHQELQVTDIKTRAMLRFEEEQVQYQRNMEEIVKKALPQVKEAAQPERIDKDWLTYFFDKSRLVSDEEMQSAWARVLAGEANKPGAFSRRSMSLLSEMSKDDAEKLTTLRRFCWEADGELLPIVPNTALRSDHNVFRTHGIRTQTVRHLESIGLVSVSDDALGLGWGNKFEVPILDYYGKRLRLSPIGDNPTIAIGCLVLTSLGQELLNLCETHPIQGVWEHVIQFLKDYSPEEI